MLHEWDRLRGRETLIIGKVKEFHEIKSWAKANGVHVHFGTLHDVCVEKHSELPEDKRNLMRLLCFQVTLGNKQVHQWLIHNANWELKLKDQQHKHGSNSQRICGQQNGSTRDIKDQLSR